MVEWERAYRALAFRRCIGISPPCLARGLVLWFWDTLAFNGYPVAVGVVDWLVGDESNRSSVDDEHRVIENIGS